MANNLINTKQLIDDLNNAWAKHTQYLDTASSAYLKLVNSAKLPSSYVEAVKTQAENNKKLEKSVKDLERAELKAQRARVAELKLQAKREKAFDTYEKQLQREQRLLDKTQGLYNRVQRGINQVTKQYQDLAVRKELNGKLSAKEEITLGKLEAKLNKYQTALKKVDANIGKHQRNVGNYKSAFDGLGFSIAQLTREAPAFANSMQTGFMAISNNLPMLFDEIKKLRVENKALAAEGKATKSVFRSLGAAIFSFQTLLSAGVLLLTLYGDEIFGFIGGLFKSKSAAEAAAEAQKKFNKQLVETRGNIGLEIVELKALVEVANDETLSRQKRNEALQVLQNKYPKYFKNLDLEKLKSEQVKKAIDDITLSLENKAKMQAAENLVTEAYKKVLEEQTEVLDNSKNAAKDAFSEQRRQAQKTLNELESALKNYKNVNETLSQDVINDFDEKISIARKKLQEFSLSTRDEWISDETVNQVKKRTKSVTDEYDASVEILKNILKDAPSILDLFGNGSGKDKERDKLKDLELQKKGLESWRLELQKQIEIYKKILPLYGEFTKEGKFLRENIEALEFMLEPLNKAYKDTSGIEKQIQATERWEATMRRLRANTEAFLSNFSTDFINNSPLGSLTVFLDGTFETLMAGADTSAERFAVSFNTIAESAQQAFNFIDSLSQQNFEAQYARLEQQKNIAIQFAGESTTAQAEIERQYEEKRKQIQRQQAQAQKQQAIFNIGVDTAQAVIATLAQNPPPAGLPLAALVSAIGLAQLVAVQSQQIPQFWQGGEVGGMRDIIVNDDPYGVKGSNYKEVIEKPNGQLLTPQGKNVKMRVPKGSYVHPTYDAFINSLDNELINNNIMPVGQSNIMPMVINNGLTKDDIYEVMSAHGKGVVKAINNKESFRFDINERGINKYVVKNGETRKIMNSRYSGKGKSV